MSLNPHWTMVTVLTMVLPLACSSPGSDLPMLPSTSTISSYRLGAGDQLDINVFGADELKGRYSVQDDGTISVLLIGKVPAVGHTADELENEISSRLKKGSYITKPVTTVSVVAYRPFYILGEVAKPGGYPYASGMRVLSA